MVYGSFIFFSITEKKLSTVPNSAMSIPCKDFMVIY